MQQKYGVTGRAMQANHEPDWPTVEQFIRQHPGGADFETIALTFNCSRQRVMQVFSKATKKILKQLAERGMNNIHDLI